MAHAPKGSDLPPSSSVSPNRDGEDATAKGEDNPAAHVSKRVHDLADTALSLAKHTAVALTETEEGSPTTLLVAAGLLMASACALLGCAWCGLRALWRRIFGRWTRLDKPSRVAAADAAARADGDDEHAAEEDEMASYQRQQRQQQKRRKAAARVSGAKGDEGLGLAQNDSVAAEHDGTGSLQERVHGGGSVDEPPKRGVPFDETASDENDSAPSDLRFVVLVKPDSGGMGLRVSLNSDGRTVVTGVTKGGVAEAAGLRVGDCIWRVDEAALPKGTTLAKALTGRRHALGVAPITGATARYANPHQSRPRQATSREAEQGGDGLDQYLVGPPPVPQQESPPDLIVMESPSQTTNAADDEERREREAPMILMT